MGVGLSQVPYEFQIIGNNFHDTVGPGIGVINTEWGEDIVENIIAKCRGVGILVDRTTNSYLLKIKNNTIDDNLGNGIEFVNQLSLSISVVENNIISNHTQAGTYGLTVDSGTTAANSVVAMLVDYNTYYNNTANLNNLNYGPHDTHGGSNPYIGQSTEDYTLNVAVLTPANAFPGIQFPNHSSGQSKPENYLYPGAVQPQILPFPQTLV